MTLRIVEARSEGDIAEMRRLFREYEGSLDVDLNAQGIDEEIASLPGKYAAPRGALFLALGSDRPVGCAGVRPFAWPRSCEVKRLYVQPSARGRGAGRALVRQAIGFAREAGYRDILLDTLPDMQAAIALYESLGFERVPPYWNNPLPHVVYFAKRLGPGDARGPIEIDGAR
jgi:ribosomal protein S18 acetylase RimI-like enzyme